MAHSWPKRRSDVWLNHAEPRQPRGEKYLQMRPVRDVRRRASLCLARPVTPEVAGSSPVAPVERVLQDSLQVVEGELELRGHIARMLGITVGVHRVLSAANELPLVPSMSWAWSNPNLRDHDQGLIGLRSISATSRDP